MSGGEKTVQCDESTAGFSDCPGGDFFPAQHAECPDVLGVAAAGIGAYFTSLNASVEFEYLYVDKEISVDKILNKTKRKKVEKFETERMEIFAPINSWHLDNMKNRQLKVTDYSSGVAGQPDRRYVMIYSGDRKIIFEPSEAMVKALQSVAPRKVFFD